MELGTALSEILDARRVLTRPIDRIAFANDASVYRLVPAAVVMPASIDEIRSLFRFSHRQRIPLTFRTAGTSLSGQAVTDGILVVLSRHWSGVHVEENGKRVRVQPGAIGGTVNLHLARHGVKIGPDPASISAAMMGGILANNSSGMCCGVEQNAYHTLESMTYVLPDGVVVDSSLPDAEERFARQSPGVAEGLLEMRRRLLADDALVRRIRFKYRMKNTNGYSLNALLDYRDPVDILTHLMIGSEGTFGFIAEAVLHTVPNYPMRYTGLLYFEDVPRACSAIVPLRDSGARALELMDRASLRSIENRPGVPSAIHRLPPEAAALLVEYQCSGAEELGACRRACEQLILRLPVAAAPEFTRDPGRQAALWRVRKGLIPSVGAMRRRGTSFIIEDVVFPVERLAQGVGELQLLLASFGYADAIVFGHAKDGNLHFVLTQAFDDRADVERYDRFMQALADLVARRYGGALKAEHGTGRNMAPFVEAEWGARAYGIMRDLKRLIDPEGLLNPGVLISDDPRSHVTHLKDLPRVESEVDPCIECGFCERVCPSRELTLTPRQRIVVRREISRLLERGDGGRELNELQRDYHYAALETCATDGLCAGSCPVDIDTGGLVKRLRGATHGAARHELARLTATRLAWIERVARAALHLAGFARRLPLEALSRQLADLPRPGRGRVPRTVRSGAAAVYFPSCVCRVLGPDPRRPDEEWLPDVVLRVAERAGISLWIPDDVAGVCCGLPFSSKGYAEAHRQASRAAMAAMRRWSDGGALPVVVDNSPCAHALLHDEDHAGDRPEILDGIQFARRELLPRLSITRPAESVALHPSCSVSRMELAGEFHALAGSCARQVTIPLATGCCGFAGDRGLTHPELTAAALRGVVEELASRSFDGYYSSSRTCELGLSRATDRPYRSFWHLLDESTSCPP